MKKEAVLLDSWLYIFKSMLAIAAGYYLGSMFKVTRLDMVSVLLGVMYNLEATNISAVKNGINQLLASFLGAMITGILVYLLGVNIITIALGMGLTIYISVKINYRSISAVAIFTSIYMTQLIQHDALGNPNILLTIRIRIFALGLGILIAVIFNYIFSFLYYKKIIYKRLEFIKLKSLMALKLTRDYVEAKDAELSIPYDSIFTGIFADIENVRSSIFAIKQESVIPYNSLEKENIILAEDMTTSLKIIVHMAYDLCYVKDAGNLEFTKSEAQPLNELIHSLEKHDFQNLKNEVHQDYPLHASLNVQFHEDIEKVRALHSLNLMQLEYDRLEENIKKIRA
ncbi:MAG: aromatic acid exporter family protein [Clostridiaceae bacterium]